MAAVFTSLHIFAGAIALIAGAVALSVTKGGNIHRRSGLMFVASMLFMSASGAAIAAFISVRISVVAGLLTFYLVSTSLLTVRRIGNHNRRIEMAGMLFGFVTGVLGIMFGAMALQTESGALDRYPAAIYFVFGCVALIGATLDARMLLSKVAKVAKGISGKHRIARHLWRMCFGMYMATSAFFLGQAKLFPDILRHAWLLAVPVLMVVLAMLYWLTRTLFARRPIAQRKIL
jgi:uncharacterized membrane protein YfcA